MPQLKSVGINYGMTTTQLINESKTMKFELTAERRRRVIQGIQESQRVIDKEMSYSEDLRNVELIRSNEQHIERMAKALEAGVLVTR